MIISPSIFPFGVIFYLHNNRNYPWLHALIVKSYTDKKEITMVSIILSRAHIDTPSGSPDLFFFVRLINHVPDFFLIKAGLLLQGGDINALS
jgi:hypothetical protein